MRIILLSCAILAAGCAEAQLPQFGPFDPQRGLPDGIRIDNVSVYGGFYDLSLGSGPGMPASLQMAPSGTSADLGWYVPGRRGEFFVKYSGAYNVDAEHSGFGGFDHKVTFGMETKLSPRVTLSFEAAGESVTLAGLLFEPSQDLELVRESPRIDQLGSALTSGFGTQPGSAPLAIELYGGRRRDAMAGLGLSFQQSPRVEWHVRTSGMRDLPSEGNEPGVGNILYSGVTNAQMSAGLSYLVSRRTTLVFDTDYLWSNSAYARSQMTGATVSLQHSLSEKYFVQVDGGGGNLTGLKGGSLASYRAGAGMGVRGRSHTLIATVRRDLSDYYGLGADSVLNSQLAWTWHRPATAWSLESSLGYEKLSGPAIALQGAWVYEFSVRRQITQQLACVAEGVYAAGLGGAQFGYSNAWRRGAKLAMIWTPQAGRR